jgi:hypothetical protein
MSDEPADAYAAIPVIDDFAQAVRAQNYRPLPDDWMIGFSDVAGSTQAVAEGRYKAVNMIGAGVIAAVSNALGRKPFPFVFGGDGASFAVGPADAAAAREALKAIAVFAREEFQLELRVATIRIADIRAAGRDVRVGRYGASPHCAYAMFAGGGLSWFEGRAKLGEYALEAAPPGTRPDLSDLSCRWGVAPAKHGVILSVILAPRGEDPRFAALVEEVVRISLGAADGGRPITLASLIAGKAGQAVEFEAAIATPPGHSRVKARLAAAGRFALGVVFHKLKLRAGAFDARLYANDVAANADFRKFDDGLRLTLDCSPAFADALEARLAAADEFAEFGAFRQTSAQLTCFVPSITDRGHLHFVDGAGGGYTMAAKAMKARQAARAA